MLFILPLPGVDHSPGLHIASCCKSKRLCPIQGPWSQACQLFYSPIPPFTSVSQLLRSTSWLFPVLIILIPCSVLSPQSYDLLSQEEISLSKNISFIYQDIDYRAVCIDYVLCSCATRWRFNALTLKYLGLGLYNASTSPFGVVFERVTLRTL